MGTKTTDEWLAEADGRLALFEKNLPRQIDPIALSRSKLPFKALSYRETLIWRVTELGRTAVENFKKDRVAAATLLTRAVVETTAALWYLRKKMTAALEAQALGDIDDYLMKLTYGTRVWEEFPAAISVLTFVDSVEKELEGFRKQYDSLSEVAHPNYSGTTGLFSKIDRDNMLVNVGPNAEYALGVVISGTGSLSAALFIFEHCYDKLADEFPAFVELCEAAIEQKAKEVSPLEWLCYWHAESFSSCLFGVGSELHAHPDESPRNDRGGPAMRKLDHERVIVISVTSKPPPRIALPPTSACKIRLIKWQHDTNA
jgi:hypothetical protein